VATGVAAGTGHSCALMSDGTIGCWGWGGLNQLGNGSSVDSATPTLVSTQGAANAISAGGTHTCAVLGGRVACWGANAPYGVLGVGTMTESTHAVLLFGLSGVSAIGAGLEHTCVVLSMGNMECWGNDQDGELGNGATMLFASAPIPVSSPAGLGPAIGVTAGAGHSCALLSGGRIACWGRNDLGQLGVGSFDYSTTPTLVSNLSGALAVSAGGNHTCAVLSDHTVACWGDVSFGQNGFLVMSGSNAPAAVAGLTGAVAVAAGADHTCAMLSAGTAVCWGLDDLGQLGDGADLSVLPTSPAVRHDVPSPVVGLAAVTALAAGDSHTCAVSAGGVGCWGWNQNGQLGTLAVRSSSTPLPVDLGGL
jgi:alpha-tubulin suppressor-like RCC1 family protein